MILIVISVVLLLLSFIPFLIYVFRDNIDVDTAVCITGISLIIWFVIASVSAGFVAAGYTQFEPKEYDKLIHVIEYSNSYSMEVEEEIEHWNKTLNDYNNLWCRFTVEDRSQYYIDINIYLSKFEKCK